MPFTFPVITPTALDPLDVPIYDPPYTPIDPFPAVFSSGFLAPAPNSTKPLWSFGGNVGPQLYSRRTTVNANVSAPFLFNYFAPSIATYDTVAINGSGVGGATPSPSLSGGYFSSVVNSNGVNAQSCFFPYITGESTGFPYAIFYGNAANPADTTAYLSGNWPATLNDIQYNIVATAGSKGANKLNFYKQFSAFSLNSFEAIAPGDFPASTTVNIRAVYSDNTNVYILYQVIVSASLTDDFIITTIDKDFNVSSVYLTTPLPPVVKSYLVISVCPTGFLFQPNAPTFDPLTNAHILSYDGATYTPLTFTDNTSVSISFLFGTTMAIDEDGTAYFIQVDDFGSGLFANVGFSFSPGNLIINPPKIINPEFGIPNLPCYNSCQPYPGIT